MLDNSGCKLNALSNFCETLNIRVVIWHHCWNWEAIHICVSCSQASGVTTYKQGTSIETRDRTRAAALGQSWAECRYEGRTSARPSRMALSGRPMWISSVVQQLAISVPSQVGLRFCGCHLSSVTGRQGPCERNCCLASGQGLARLLHFAVEYMYNILILYNISCFCFWPATTRTLLKSGGQCGELCKSSCLLFLHQGSSYWELNCLL